MCALHINGSCKLKFRLPLQAAWCNRILGVVYRSRIVSFNSLVLSVAHKACWLRLKSKRRYIYSKLKFMLKRYCRVFADPVYIQCKRLNQHKRLNERQFQWDFGSKKGPCSCLASNATGRNLLDASKTCVFLWRVWPFLASWALIVIQRSCCKTGHC